MKYLNKIVFINSADKSLKYAEVSLDGNVHFIGTQGVGKSTLLRAILFFYNADKQKLGIPREKKTFDEYYFPFLNSYIIFEVQEGNTIYCVLAFKSQGRVAFRFFDSSFNKDFFIDKEGRAFESWDKTRESLGKNIYYTRIIHSYEEYRNILYGNNKGLPAEFRKYALIESKQYQNIPRTITNVFLNANLSAEFVKETIIKSLNEDEIKIDLTTYSQNHLKDFENHLNDIKKWTDLNRNGENQVERQADNLSNFYSALKYLEKNLAELACQLGWALDNVKDQSPRVQKRLKIEESQHTKIESKLSELDSLFERKKEKIQEQVGKFKGKLDDIRNKKKEYAAQKIEEILERVSKKSSLELEKKNLNEEKAILTSKFQEIQQRYTALLNQLENQFKEFQNTKQTEINDAKDKFLLYKEELSNQYEVIYDEITNQHQKELGTKQSVIKEKEKAITDLRIKRSEVKNKRFYEKEIQNCITEISNRNNAITNAENSISQANERIKNIQKEWTLEESELKATINREIEKENEHQKRLQEDILRIDSKLENSKDSFYSWLNEQVPDWEKTIGKVIDEENVLFKAGLNPHKKMGDDLSFYGVDIDLQEINKSVKTVSDYQKEKEVLDIQIQNSKKTVAKLEGQLNDDLEKLKKRFQPKIKEQKQAILNNEFITDKSKLKLDELNVRLNEVNNKAVTEKKSELQKIENNINRLSEEKIAAEEQVKKVEENIGRLIDAKKKEKEKRLKIRQQELKEQVDKINALIQSEKNKNSQKQELLKIQQKQELDAGGADTLHIGEIDLRLSEIEPELVFIDNNRDTVAEYNKDKRELFDREDEFKTQKSLNEKQLETELTKHKQQREKVEQEVDLLKTQIEETKRILSGYNDDLNAFETFSKSEIFPTVQEFLTQYSEIHQTERSCSAIIDDLKENYYNSVARLTDLQGAINKFTGNFQDNNLFSFQVKFSEKEEYFEFAEMLKEFVDESKISEYKKRFEERFAHIIRRIGIETGDLISKEGEISQVIRDINNDFLERNFVGAVKSMELRTINSTNRIFQLLVEIKTFNDENPHSIGKPNLFSPVGQTSKNEKAISLLKQLIKEMAIYKEKEIRLSDSFELEFRIVENDNDTG
ncbi:MAG: ATP-binding protein, partial [Dysgonamonadaceae bacterium]|nr:ATP-binding protein [Dysgonamonadaceae bacterium]